MSNVSLSTAHIPHYAGLALLIVMVCALILVVPTLINNLQACTLCPGERFHCDQEASLYL